MEYRRLGRTDIEVSVIAMGCWGLAGGGTWGPQDEEESIATVLAALEAGINFFDTAEGYGRGLSETILGKALKGRRHEAVIATKVSTSHLAPDDVRQACEGSLRRLGTDYIDLYQIHWPSREVPIAETLGAMERLREEGKIRAIGVSNFGVKDLTALLEVGRCETNQLPYSLLWRAIEYEILPVCVEHEIGVLCYSPLAQGLLTGKFRSADEVPPGRARTRHFRGDRPEARHGEPGAEEETFAAIASIREICERIERPMAEVSLAWLLARPGVASVIAGARRPEQIRQNAKAAELKLAPEVVNELTSVTEALKQRLGPNPDMWQSDSRMA
ncbi:MAG: aldo/keto reductase [Anaerolineae bacterium]